MFTCAECEILACRTGNKDKMPKNCPMRKEEIIAESKKEYQGDTLAFARQAALTESTGYCKWNRVQEIIYFCKEMGYEKIGVAFCVGLKKEAGTLARILRKAGFQVVSVVCKNGSIPKGFLNIKDSEQVRPGQFEPMCNPIGQALLLNKAGTDFNVAVGLCVGHDSLFFKYAEAPVTVLVAKDRALAHNPVGALYCAEGYFKNRTMPDE